MAVPGAALRGVQGGSLEGAWLAWQWQRLTCHVHP